MKDNHVIPTKEKAGYALGDLAANFVWAGALAYLPVFYTDTFGISAAAAALLILIVRLSDGVTDIMMGMIADRTHSSKGQFRPWILWSAPFLGAFMILCFTTPDLSQSGKLVYAYVTYIGLTLAYTVNNVPYSALMGVMTSNEAERTSLSSYRFAGAFLGGLLITGFLPDLVRLFGQGDDQTGYQYSMFLFAGLLVVFFIITYRATNERVSLKKEYDKSLKEELLDLCKNLPFIIIPLITIAIFFYYRNLTTALIFFIVGALTVMGGKKLIARAESGQSRTQKDIADLITNKPWLILLGVGFLYLMASGIRKANVAYYFKYYLGEEALTGRYFIALLIFAILGAICATSLAKKFGKRGLFIFSFFMAALFSSSIYFIPPENVLLVFTAGCLVEFFHAMSPILFFSMLGDCADYSQWKNGRRATGLVFSAGTFVNKAGGGFAGALVLMVLAANGYDGLDPASAEAALPGMRSLMSWVPSMFELAGILLLCFYPLKEKILAQIGSDLVARANA